MSRLRTDSRFVPYGYRLAEKAGESDNSRPDDHHGMRRVVLDPMTSGVVSRIFHDCEAGQSAHQIAAALAAEGHPSPRQ